MDGNQSSQLVCLDDFLVSVGAAKDLVEAEKLVLSGDILINGESIRFVKRNVLKTDRVFREFKNV